MGNLLKTYKRDFGKCTETVERNKLRNILKLCIEKIWGNILELQRGDIGKCTVTIQESRDFF